MSKLLYLSEISREHARNGLNNQDSFMTFELCFMNDEKILCMVVADGMGGEANGDVASRTAVDAFSQTLFRLLQGEYRKMEGKKLNIARNFRLFEDYVTEAIESANREVKKTAPSMETSGTTFSAAFIIDSYLLIANVGDSPIYLYSAKNQELSCVSKIMNVAGEKAEKIKKEIGITEESEPLQNYEYSDAYFRDSSRITGFLGRRERLGRYEEPESSFGGRGIYFSTVDDYMLQKGDKVIVGSDGAFGIQTKEEIKKIIVDNSEERKQKVLLNYLFRGAGVDDDKTAIVYIQE